jgi:hypothetical protein
MKGLAFIAVALAFAGVALAAGTVPKGWILAGTSPQDYSVTLDNAQFHSGASSALLASQTPTPNGFGTLMQTIVADSYRGKRVRFTAYVRSEEVESWAGLWCRVDGAGSPPAMLAFDNMYDRSIKGNTEWQAYGVVLDVAQEASAIAYGVLLAGPGKIWIDTAHFEVVDKNVPTTGGKPGSSVPTQPTNLDFEL